MDKSDLEYIFDFIHENENKIKRRDGTGFAPNKYGKDCDATMDVIRSIENGMIFWGKIDYPEGVIYNFLQKKTTSNISMKQNTALILTLWNASINFELNNI